MALQSLAGGLVPWPETPFKNTSAGTGTVDANGEYLAAVIYNPVATTIRGFAAYVSVVAAAGDLVFALETVSAGLPSGTLLDASATATVTVSATGVTKADFGANVTLPVGLFAATIRRVSGTAQITFLDRIQGTAQFPAYGLANGSFYDDNIPLVFMPFVGVPPSETYLRMPFLRPVYSGEGVTSPGANGEKAVAVTVPFSARACGIRFAGRQQNAPSTPNEVRLYADGELTTPLATGQINVPTGTTIRPYFVPFSSPVEVSAGGTYYLAIHAKDGTNPPALWTWTLTAAGMAAIAGMSVRQTRNAVGDAWSSDANYSIMALVLDRLDDGLQATNPPATGEALTYTFQMTNSSGVPLTGLTITAKRSIGGAALSSATGTVTELSGGYYKFAASAADMNGAHVGHLFTASGAIPKFVSILTGTPPAKNSALTYSVLITDSDGDAVTGATMTFERSLDGGAIATAGGTITERSDGIYAVAAAAADMNGDTAAHLLTANVTIKKLVEFATWS